VDLSASVSPAHAQTLATLALGAVRGLHLDLLATGERKRTELPVSVRSDSMAEQDGFEPPVLVVRSEPAISGQYSFLR
jgi:hypothetical protein